MKIFKHVVQRSHSEPCSLKKMHTILYLFSFHMLYFIFSNKKRAVRKKSLNTFSLAANIHNGVSISRTCFPDEIVIAGAHRVFEISYTVMYDNILLCL